eukprot:CAMPEP_0177679896 /NCGR_PEP_ID=MMETSP0447-20121125/29870_1 /TAXON_ID=0 /ORGANISM="Stygamoeba regulata, Strain BSH-02190019" /LENGTH=163 /DNA_ID=CAMNT_0019189163 /DNA_START=39 /DNA_END=530 /DNA_ORIENTATION=-
MSKRAPATVKDVPADVFIKEYAAHLKRSGRIRLPKWVDLVKTAHFKELSPYDQDWYYVRAASIARRIYLRGGVGVGAFRHIYGRNKDRGTIRSHHAPAAGGLIRHILQSLESLEVVQQDKKGGRIISSIGRRDLDRVAGKIASRSRGAVATTTTTTTTTTTEA